MTVTSPQAALHETPRSGFRRAKHRARVVRWTMLVALVLLLEAATRTGWIDRNQMVAPSEILAHVAAIIPSTHFVTDLTRTSVTILAAFALGVLGGVPLGVLLWRVRVVGRVLEPFIVTGYAMPTLLFYPILVAVLGLNAGPIIVIASTMALIPIALTTMVALGDVKPVLHKLARSVGASRRQQYFKVLFPAATPLIFPGIKLGFIYAVIGTIAMEFILASKGLGFRAGFMYRELYVADMWAYIAIVVVFSIAVNSALGLAERAIRRDML